MRLICLSITSKVVIQELAWQGALLLSYSR